MATETTPLEKVLEEGQASEEAEAPEEVLEEKAESKTLPGPEEKPRIQYGAEKPDALQAKIDAERDKQTNRYREQREADLAYIDSLKSRVKNLQSESIIRAGNKRIESILAGDEEAGISPDETESRAKALKDFNEQYRDYKAQSVEVSETAQVISNITKTMPDAVVKEFGLDDANPNIRAVNGVKFLEDTIGLFQRNQDFLMTLEYFLPKGDELRKQLQDIADGLSEFNTKKSKELYLKDKLQGVKVARKKPPAPSDVSGGLDLDKLSSVELIERWLTKQTKK